MRTKLLARNKYGEATGSAEARNGETGGLIQKGGRRIVHENGERGSRLGKYIRGKRKLNYKGDFSAASILRHYAQAAIQPLLLPLSSASRICSPTFHVPSSL